MDPAAECALTAGSRAPTFRPRPRADVQPDGKQQRRTRPPRFTARFHEQMGCSVMQYATDWRMNLACRLLADDGLSLAEAAQRVGYENIPAFSRSFKARVGVAPGAWRAQQRGG
ncbi:helix-turn-helix domain-containing protein [Roseateles sp.]|uniref:helix-turn-helix domain-containing protein n=1 Tax=Roseateles sp. TaxID=1971397 RepID=UPI00392F101F